MTDYTEQTEYAVPVPGRGMVWTPAFLARYGYVLERARGPRRERVEEVDEDAWKARALANLRAAAQRGRKEQELGWNGPGAKRPGWVPPMTGEALKARRLAAGLSQRDLAKRAEVSRAALSELEAPRAGRGKILPLTWGRLLAALEAAEAEK